MTVQFYGRPTMYRGVRMRSRLEAKVASMFDELNLDWEYEPLAFRYGGEEYLPDFQLAEHTYVEVKPWIQPDGKNGERITIQLEDVRRGKRVLKGSVPDCIMWLVYSNGSVLKMLPEPEIFGYLSRCRHGHLNIECEGHDRSWCFRCGEAAMDILPGVA